MAGVSWRDVSLLWMYAGRALWDDDDLIATTLSAFGGRLQLMEVDWQTQNAAQVAHYWNVAAGLPRTSRFSLGAEAGLRDDKGGLHLRYERLAT
jgi:hypothetical protein